MSLLTTSAASIHQLAAAAAFVGPPSDDLFSEKEEGKVIKSWWSGYSAIANTILSAGWIIEQHTLRTKHHLDQETDEAVRTKDVCVVGAMLTNVANIVADQMAKRAFPEGVRMTSTGEISPGTASRAEKYQRYFKVMKTLNRAFVAGVIGFTPFVNFNVLRSYRPGTIYRLFT